MSKHPSEDPPALRTFDGGYGRTGRIWVQIDECMFCHKPKPVLVMDGSAGEYAAGKICDQCTRLLFAGFQE